MQRSSLLHRVLTCHAGKWVFVNCYGKRYLGKLRCFWLFILVQWLRCWYRMGIFVCVRGVQVGCIVAIKEEAITTFSAKVIP